MLGAECGSGPVPFRSGGCYESLSRYQRISRDPRRESSDLRSIHPALLIAASDPCRAEGRGDVQPLQPHPQRRGDAQALRHLRRGRANRSAARHLSRLRRPGHPQRGRDADAGADALGHALAGLRARRQEDRPRRHQCAQHQEPALAPLARHRAPLPRALHVLQRVQQGRAATSGSPSARTARRRSSPASGRRNGPACAS